jgi:hypothetical protein
MKVRTLAAGSLAAGLLTIGGPGLALAAPGDYGTLPVNPNDVTDSTAYAVASSVQNPNGQPGVTAVYTHRDGSRQITETILVLPDPAAAAAALSGSPAVAVIDPTRQPAAVGTGGTVVSGLSPDRSQSVTVLTFTEGNAASTIEFDGPANDPVPTDLVVDLGQQQAAAIRGALAG